MRVNNTLSTLLIGGGGFIGSHLVSALLSMGRRVRVLELPYRNHVRLIPQHANLQWIEGNFGNIQDIRSALRDTDAVFHLVSTTQPQSSNDNPAFDIQSNLLPTIGLLEQMRLKKNIPLIFISSGGTVYGKPQQSTIPETHPTEPQCSYGIVKLTIEKYLALYQLLHGINYRVLRLANPYGPGQEANRTQGVIGTFLPRILNGLPLEVWGDGSVIRDYLYIGDAIEALLLAERYQGNQRIFNIGSGNGHSVKEIIAALENITGKKAGVHFTAGREFDVTVSVLNTGLAQRELGWKPRTELTEGLRITIDWLKRSSPEIKIG